jgi:hypothetical protein
MQGMSEHKRNMIVTACLEANAFYNGQAYGSMASDKWYAFQRIAEAYLLRVETLTKGE